MRRACEFRVRDADPSQGDAGEIELYESLGHALVPPVEYTPTTFAAPCPPVVAVAASASHFLLLTRSSVLCLGPDNRFSQLGTSDLSCPPKLTPIDFFEGLEPTLIAAGGLHSIIVTADGAAYTFGSDREGQCGGTGGGEPALLELGEGEAEDQPGVVGVACGSAHSVLVTASGVWVAGASKYSAQKAANHAQRCLFLQTRRDSWAWAIGRRGARSSRCPT